MWSGSYRAQEALTQREARGGVHRQRGLANCRTAVSGGDELMVIRIPASYKNRKQEYLQNGNADKRMKTKAKSGCLSCFSF